MLVKFYSAADWGVHGQLFVKLVVPRGKWTHPSGMYDLDASTEEARQKIVDAFNEQQKFGRRVPVVLDHGRESRDQIGWVVKMWQDERGIWAAMDITDSDAVQKIREGTWKGVSISLRENMTLPRPDGSLRVLDIGVVEVSITPFPALPTADSFEPAEKLNAVVASKECVCSFSESAQPDAEPDESFDERWRKAETAIEALMKDGLQVQTLLISKDRYLLDEAIRWAKSHGFKVEKVHPTDDYYRIRQFSPKACATGSVRTIEITDGIKAVVCKKRPGFSGVDGGSMDMADLDFAPKGRLDPKAKVRNRPQPIFPHNSPRVKDNKDHFPINTIGRARNALARAAAFARLKRPPDWFRGTLKEFLRAVVRAVKRKYPSIDTSGFEKKHLGKK